MMRNLTQQNLQNTDPNRQPWARYPGTIGAVVTAVNYDSTGHPIVIAVAKRYNITFGPMPSQTPSPAVGDVGFITFVDSRRDSPVWVGVRNPFSPQSVVVVYGAPNRTTSVSTITVKSLLYNRTYTNVPFVVVPGNYPMAGDYGILFAMDGHAEAPIYLGPLSTAPPTAQSS